MGYRYIAVQTNAEQMGGLPLDVKTLLGQAGLQHRLTSGPIELFTSPETPTSRLANGVVVIGHLFSRSGAAVADEARLAAIPPGRQTRRHLLDHYWGEYLVLQGDPSHRELTITRDVSGGVPCFYSGSGRFRFITSDVSIATNANLYERRVDWEYISCCVTYPHQKSERTGLLGISELLPGCTLSLSDARCVAEMDWSPWTFVAKEHRHTDPRAAVADVRQAVTLAVKTWGDVDDSILLEMSGGLDSSIVAMCLQKARARMTCCTLVTPVPGADERLYANLIAKALGVGLQSEVLSFETAVTDFDPQLSTASPRIGCLQYAIDNVIGAAGARHDVDSYYSGSGGDSVFCYLTNAAPAADAFKERGLATGISALRNLSALHQCTLWTAGKLTLKKLLRAPKAPRSPHVTFVNPSRIATAPESHPWFDAPADALPGDRERIFGLSDTQIYRDMAPRGVTRWLRMPLLSQPVFEACLKVPSWMWIADGRNRAVARAAFADVLPAEILNRRSKGNFLAYLAGVYQRNRGQIRDFLQSGRLSERGLLNAAALNAFLAREDLPMRDRLFMEILDLCMMENWLRHQPG